MSFIKASQALKLTILLILVGLFSLGVNDVYAQHHSSLYQWQHEVYGYHTASMSMANVALSPFANPAVGGRLDHVELWSNLGSASIYSIDYEFAGYSPNLTNFGLAITQEHYWLSLSADDFTYSWFEQGPDRLKSIKLYAGYQLNPTLAVGLGIGVNSWSLPEVVSHISSGGRPGQSRANASFDAGVYYTDQINTSQFIIRPEFGLSVNNIGSYFEIDAYVMTGSYHLPQAGQMRLSLGAQVETSSEWRGRSWLGAGFYTGLIKYFSRRPETVEDRSHGFIDLFTNWGSFESPMYFWESLSALDQIAMGLGAELKILELLSVRYGTLSGADRWVRERQTWGAGIDLNYVSFNITSINYKSEAQWDHNSSVIFYEMAINLPISVLRF